MMKQILSFKKLQIVVRFWLTEENQIVCSRHLESFFIGLATGEIIKQQEVVKNANLLFSKLLMLASDGPNVNKKVFRLMNESQDQEKSAQKMKILTHAICCSL